MQMQIQEITYSIIFISDESGSIYLEVSSLDHLVIDCKNGLSMFPYDANLSLSLPKTLELSKTLLLSTYPFSVCHYKGVTYVGLYGGNVDRIDSDYQITQGFLSLGNHVSGIKCYKDRLYTLVCGKPYTVRVHSLSGEPLTSWYNNNGFTYNNSMYYISTHATKLCIVSDQVIVPDRNNNRLTVYSLSGKIVRDVPCRLPSWGNIAMCSAGDDSVVVSTESTDEVFKINITTGAVSWKSPHVDQPGGVVRYGEENLLVACCTSGQIQILNILTGG